MALADAQAVVFDVDGVLVDSEYVFLTSVQHYLATQGIDEDWHSLARCIGKPDPAIFNVAAERLVALGVDRNRIVVVEDSPNGIASARAAGLYVVGFKGSQIQQDTSDADVEVASFAELQALMA